MFTLVMMAHDTGDHGSQDAGCPDLWLTLARALLTSLPMPGPGPRLTWAAGAAHTDIISPGARTRLRQFYPILPIFSSLNTRRSKRENSAWCNWLYKRVYKSP